jgi:hypothetical protein
MDMTQVDGEYANKYIDNIKVCQAVETGEISCSDTDGGFNVNEKGTITADTNIRNDSCADGFQLREYICNPEEPLGFSYSTYYCLGGCSEGKCIISQGAVCYNYDTGQYVNESYRYCSQDYAKECLAGGFWDSEFCPLGCLNGECASSTCSDTDDGTDIYVKGTVTFLGNISTDYCQGEFNLTEFKCYKPLNEPYEMRSELFICDVGCSNGVCIGFEGIEGLFRIGEPCNNDGECISGNCEYSFCAYKGGAEDCLRNDQCLSNKCINSKCTKPSYWQSVDASKTQQFGNDSHSNNFVSLFLIIGITGILGYYTKSLLVSGGTLYGLSIFFTIVGWLSPFILLGFIIAGLVFVVFMFIGKGSGG